jgi:hypothetical protein
MHALPAERAFLNALSTRSAKAIPSTLSTLPSAPTAAHVHPRALRKPSKANPACMLEQQAFRDFAERLFVGARLKITLSGRFNQT